MASPRRSGSAFWRIRWGISRGLLYFLLLVGAGIMVMPFLWMVSSSIMTAGEANSGRLVPRTARFSCPYVDLAKYDRLGVVTAFSVSRSIRPGAQELHTTGYYVELQHAEGSGQWQFRLVNERSQPIAIFPWDQPDGALTEDWLPIPESGGSVDTGNGMTITFADPAGYPTDADLSRRANLSRVDYVNCCEYPTDVLEYELKERAGVEYRGRPIPEDLSACRTAGRKVKYIFAELIGGNYYVAWTGARFRDYVWNSVRITGVTLAGILFISTLAAYAFGRMKFPGKGFLFALLLSTMMIPETVTMIPNFLTITGNNPLLGFASDHFKKYWFDSWPALTVPFMAGFFNIFLLRQFFAQIPDELWDAARIDGAGHLRFLWKVVLPLSKAPIMTVVIFSFIGSWNALLWPLIATKAGSNWWPISVGLQSFVNEAGPETNLWMAASSISMLPVLILYFAAQRQFIEGIATTGLKG